MLALATSGVRDLTLLFVRCVAAYRDGIGRAVAAVQARRKSASVLDVGTGSGLLAMMAKRAGASHVTACECFAPVARSAAACLHANGLAAEIGLVHKASTEMTASDLQGARRADIIVNELYDTELLGEGVLPTLRHALQHLATPECTVVPAAADVVAVLLESHTLAPGYAPANLRTHGGAAIFAGSGSGSPGSASWATTFVSESMFVDKLIEKGGGARLSDPLIVSTIDFCAPPMHGTHSGPLMTSVATRAGLVHAIAYWWDLKMCPGDANPLAARTEPGKGDRPTPGVLSMAPGEGWRDHWRQNVCFLDSPVVVEAGDVVTFRMCHDDWRIWFQLCTQVHHPLCHQQPASTGVPASGSQPQQLPTTWSSPPPAVEPAEMRVERVVYGGHWLRLLSDSERLAAYVSVLTSAVRAREAAARAGPDTACLVLGDGHWLALAAAQAGCGKVVDIESQQQAVRMADACFAAAGLPPTTVRSWQGRLSDESVEKLLCCGAERGSDDDRDLEAHSLGLRAGQIDVVVADPFYLESHVGAFAGGGGTPWNNLMFWPQVHAAHKMLAATPPARLVPCAARVVALAVEFAALRNPQQTVGEIEGFDLSPFCDIQPCWSSGEAGLAAGVAYDLWMYDWRPLTPAFRVMALDFSSPPPPTIEAEAERGAVAAEFDTLGTCHAVVMWLDWQLDREVCVSCAPKTAEVDAHKQVVYFLPSGVPVQPGQALRLRGATLDMQECELAAAFYVE